MTLWDFKNGFEFFKDDWVLCWGFFGNRLKCFQQVWIFLMFLEIFLDYLQYFRISNWENGEGFNEKFFQNSLRCFWKRDYGKLWTFFDDCVVFLESIWIFLGSRRVKTDEECLKILIKRNKRGKEWKTANDEAYECGGHPSGRWYHTTAWLSCPRACKMRLELSSRKIGLQRKRKL